MSPRSPRAEGIRAAGLVTQMAVSTVAGGWLGRQADSWLGTEPWLLVSGFVLGFASGLLVLFRHISRPPPPDDHEEPTPPP